MKPSSSVRCGPRRIQNSANQARWPSSHAGRLMPACCATFQASSSRSIVRASVVARASRRASASAAPARRRASAAIVAGATPCHHRSMSAVSPPGRARRDAPHEGVPVPLPRVRIVSPALAAANNGNWQTAARWQRFLAPVARVDIVGVDATTRRPRPPSC